MMQTWHRVDGERGVERRPPESDSTAPDADAADAAVTQLRPEDVVDLDAEKELPTLIDTFPDVLGAVVEEYPRPTGRRQTDREASPLRGSTAAEALLRAFFGDAERRHHKGLPMTSANRPVTHWDMALFFASLVVPCVIGLVFQMKTKYVSISNEAYYLNQSERTSGRSDDCNFMLAGAYARDGPPEGTIVNNFLCGVAAAITCLPQAISSSLLAGVQPVNGIWAGFFMSFTTALVGGRPGLISCSSLPTAVILADVARDPELGLGGAALVVILCGAWQAFVGALHLARFASLVPHTVLLGFVNGISIVLAFEQVNQFRHIGAHAHGVNVDVLHGMLLTALVSLLTALACPRLPLLGRFLPAPFAAMACSIVFGSLMSTRFPQWTLDKVAGHETFIGGPAILPPWNFPPLEVHWGSWHLWRTVIPASVRMAIVGLVESLVTLMVVDTVTDTRGSIRRECFGQALGNVMSGIFGVQGGCALFCQTVLNVGAGARGRLSGLTTAAGLFASTVLLAPLVAKIPVASVVGLMVFVSAKTFLWGMTGLVRRASVQPSDGVVIVLVLVVGVFFDFATAVLLGLVVSVLAFAWTVSSSVRLEVSSDPALQKRTFKLHGPLFFASSRSFQQMIKVGRVAEAKVALDFSDGSVLDHTALEGVVQVISRLKEGGKRVEVAGLSLADQEYIYAETGFITL